MWGKGKVLLAYANEIGSACLSVASVAVFVFTNGIGV